MEQTWKDVDRFMHGFRKDEGIWISDCNREISTKFSKQTQDALYALEDTSWWFRYRSKVILMLAEKFFSKKQLILDVGGGNGYITLQMQKKRYRIALLEPSYAACKNAKDRGIGTVICGTLDYGNIREHSVNQFLLLDVLEHIEDDMGFLKLMYQKLVPGGKILLTVPAFQVLWSSEDKAAGHYRRYTVKQVEKAAANAGFAVPYVSYFFCFLFLPVLLVRVGLEKIGILKKSEARTEEERKEIERKQFQEQKGLVKVVLRVLEQWELHKLVKGHNLCFGSSIICILEKRDNTLPKTSLK